MFIRVRVAIVVPLAPRGAPSSSEFSPTSARFDAPHDVVGGRRASCLVEPHDASNHRLRTREAFYGRAGVSMRILVADDDHDASELMRDLLATTGVHEVVLVESGEEALRQLRSGPPFDIIVTDIGFPGISGIEMLRTAVREGIVGDAVLVVCSADMEALPLALSLGARCVAKPVYAREILEAVRIRSSDEPLLTAK
jgi:CheY-like chemotaxis protein